MKNILPPNIAGEDLQITDADLLAMGFEKYDDESGSVWGVSYEIKTANFWLVIDPTRVVNLFRRNPDTDGVCLYVEAKDGLQSVVDWIQD